MCTRCGADTAEGDAFCRKCGADLGARPGEGPGMRTGRATGPAGGEALFRRNRKALWVALATGNALLLGGILFSVGGKGCGHVEGAVVSTGKPIGDFVFTPTTCKSGQRMSFFGVVLVGDGPTDGGMLVVVDPVQGKSLKIEVPGSCKPPDHEVCTEVLVRPDQCTTFDVVVDPTSTRVNNIRLMDGHARVECAFPEGGTLKVNLQFENCD